MEILVRVIDKNPLDPLASKAGDVIAVKPDNWPWSNEERTRLEWRIIQAPILQTLAETLLDVHIDPLTRMLIRRRKWTLNTALLPLANRFIGPRLQEIVILTRANVISASSLKP